MKRLLIILILLMLPSLGWGATYYCDDAGSGTECSEGSPCTFAYALTTKIATGDTVLVMPGTYNWTTQVTQKSGTTGIIVDAYDTTARPVFNGSDMTENRMIYSRGSTYRNIIFKDCGRGKAYNRSVFVDDDSAPDTTVTQCEFYNCGSIFTAQGDDITITRNLLSGCGHTGIIRDNSRDAGESIVLSHNIILGGPHCYSGTATGGDTDTLTDTGVNFVTTVQAKSGDIVYNYTDDSWGLIESVDTTSIEIDGSMSASGSWDAGDIWEIYGVPITGAYGVSVNIDAPVSFLNNICIAGPTVMFRLRTNQTDFDMRNNFFAGASGVYVNDESTAEDEVVSNNFYLNGAAVGSGSIEFESYLNNITDSTISTTLWGNNPKLDMPTTYYFIRIDDADYGACGGCTYYYYKDLAIKMLPYNIRAVLGVDVAQVGATGNYVTWNDVSELHDTYGWEIASHGLSHMSLDNTLTNTYPFTVTYGGGGSGSIVVNLSGSEPAASGTIVITEDGNSLTITYPDISSSLVLTAQRTDGASNDPWDYSILNDGMADPSAYDLGSIKGLRDYINSLTNWSCSATDTDMDYPQNTPVRILANGTYNTLSSEQILFDVTRTHYWEMEYPQNVIANQIGGGYTCSTFIYPNYAFDYQTVKSLISHGYTAVAGTNMKNGMNLLQAINVYNVGTVPASAIVNADADQDSTDGEQEDIKHAMRSMIYEAAGSWRITGFMSHNMTDWDSLDQWDWMLTALHEIGFAQNKTLSELAAMIRSSGDWSSVDSLGVVWTRDISTRTIPFPLYGGSVLINAGTSPFSDGDGDQYDYAGNLVWSDTTDGTIGAWSDGVEIGPYGWFGGVLLQ